MLVSIGFSHVLPVPIFAVADIAGFTAWSSTRDPHQVFTLLESIFQAFDAIAKEFGVFKVETIGDCYVGTCYFLEWVIPWLDRRLTLAFPNSGVRGPNCQQSPCRSHVQICSLRHGKISLGLQEPRALVRS
jgi:Adenylate and Guanylate cyclase catalytic domain